LDRAAVGPGSSWTGQQLDRAAVGPGSSWTGQQLDRAAVGPGSSWTGQRKPIAKIPEYGPVTRATRDADEITVTGVG
jgi:hypothetical protein